MADLATRYDAVDSRLTSWMARHGLRLQRISLGIGLPSGRFMRATLLLLAAQMAGTRTPLAFLPNELFTRVPYAPALEGQYIIENAVLISAAIVLGATVRGGGLVAARPQDDARGRPGRS